MWPVFRLSPGCLFCYLLQQNLCHGEGLSRRGVPPAARADPEIKLYPVYLTEANTSQRRLPSPLFYEVALGKCPEIHLLSHSQGAAPLSSAQLRQLASAAGGADGGETETETCRFWS